MITHIITHIQTANNNISNDREDSQDVRITIYRDGVMVITQRFISHRRDTLKAIVDTINVVLEEQGSELKGISNFIELSVELKTLGIFYHCGY